MASLTIEKFEINGFEYEMGEYDSIIMRDSDELSVQVVGKSRAKSFQEDQEDVSEVGLKAYDPDGNVVMEAQGDSPRGAGIRFRKNQVRAKLIIRGATIDW